MEKVYRSIPAKWLQSSSRIIRGVLYLTEERLVFIDAAHAPVVKNGAFADWSAKAPLWERPLPLIREATAKTTLQGPTLIITDARGLPWQFILRQTKLWSEEINACR